MQWSLSGQTSESRPPRIPTCGTARIRLPPLAPRRKVKLTITYPPSVGRNTAELLRVVDALQLGAAFPVATPVNWQPGDDVMITPGVTPEQAAEQFPGHKVVDVPSGKAYLRTTSPPQHK